MSSNISLEEEKIMTKKDAKKLAERYNMEIRRNPVTREAWGCSCESESLLPELDKLADCDLYDHPVERIRLGSDGYLYVMHGPSTWFDLWGWAD